MTTPHNPPRFASIYVDELLKSIPSGSTITREYIKEVISSQVEQGPVHRGIQSRKLRGLKQKSKSSRGSRLMRKIVARLKILADRGAIQLLGTTHILIIDMDRADGYSI